MTICQCKTEPHASSSTSPSLVLQSDATGTGRSCLRCTLLIEDDLTIASFVSKGLKEAGFVVEHASEGKAGLHMALNSCYDAAVIDIMLPGLDGLAIIDELRQRGRLADAPRHIDGDA